MKLLLYLFLAWLPLLALAWLSEVSALAQTTTIPGTLIAPTFRHSDGPAVVGQVLTATATNGSMAWSNALAGGGSGSTQMVTAAIGTLTVSNELSAGSLNVNSLVVSNGFPAFGSDGWVQYANSGTNKAEAVFLYDDGDNTLYVNTVSAIGVTASNIVASFPGSSIAGVTNGGNAAAGVIGQHIQATFTARNVGTTAQYYDMTNIVLTPGDWDVTAMCRYEQNGATYTSLNMQLGISDTSGNFTTGLDIGDNWQTWVQPGTVIDSLPLSIPAYRISIATNRTVYLKGFSTYTVGTPQTSGRISARRVR